jgi:stage II sporulation protein B
VLHERKQEPQVIPLYREEFAVVEERTEGGKDAVADDGKETLYDAGYDWNESERRREPIVLSEFRTDYGTYRSPFEEETERVVRIIRESQSTVRESDDARHIAGREGHGPAERRPMNPDRAADKAVQAAREFGSGHNEQYREPFASGYEGYRFGADERDAESRSEADNGADTYHWDMPQLGTRYAKSSSTPPWTRIVLSVAGAVLTGVVFGFLVLSMFTDEPLPFQLFGGGKAKAPVAVQTGTGAKAAAGTSGSGTTAVGASGGAVGTPAASAQAAAAATTSASSAAAGGNAVAVNLPGKSYFFLQHGIFSTAAAAQAEEAALKTKGYAFAAETGDKTTVYAGFALQKSDATQLASKLKDDKLDVFVKAIDVPAAAKLNWDGKASAAELSGYFQQGDKLAQMIGSLTVLHLAETKPSAIEAATLDTIKTAHQTWLAAAKPVATGAAASVAPKMQQIATALNTAVISMEEYRKNPSDSFLWQAQAGLMQYVLAEKSMMAELAVQ